MRFQENLLWTDLNNSFKMNQHYNRHLEENGCRRYRNGFDEKKYFEELTKRGR